MKADHAFFTRIHAGLRAVLLVVLGLPLIAAAANSGNIGRANITGNGNSVSVTQATVNSGGSTIPVSPNIGGWTQAGNYGVPPTASGTTMNRTVTGETVISGVRYPFQAGYQNPWSSLVQPALTAAGVVASGGCSLISSGMMTLACATAVQTAMPYVYQWITNSGGRFNPDTGQLERKDTSNSYTSDGKQYKTSDVNVNSGFMYSYAASCAAWISAAIAFDHNARTLSSATPTKCNFTGPAWGGNVVSATTTSQTWTGCPSGWFYNKTTGACTAADGSPWLPSSMNDIAPYMQNVTPPSGNIVGEILGPGQGTIPDSVPTVTGPASVQGPVSTTTNPDGTKTSSQTTYNFNTAGNTITNTTNNTVTNNYNSSNQLTSTTTKTETPTASSTSTGVAAKQNSDDPPTQCDKYPNSLGCTELDTPAVQIPKDTKNVTFASEERLGGGSCPANPMWARHTFGDSVVGVDWSWVCTQALPLRAMIMALAAFAALLIVMPGGKAEV